MLRPVNLALWWNLCRLTLMVSVSLTPSHLLLCVNNTIHVIRACSLFVSQSMLPPLPTLMSPHMPVTMMRPETPTWETGTVSTGWKTLMWLVHTSDRELCLGPDLRKIEATSIYSTWAVWSYWWQSISHTDRTMVRCFKWCCVFVSLGRSEQRDFGQTVQDCKGQNQH